jgi:predicted esterase
LLGTTLELGARRVRGWVSTGASDPARPPAHESGHHRSLIDRGLAAELHIYPGGHSLLRAEKDDLVDWWLGRAVGPSSE